MLKLGPIYPRYVGPRSNIPGGTLDGGYVRFATPAPYAFIELLSEKKPIL